MPTDYPGRCRGHEAVMFGPGSPPDRQLGAVSTVASVKTVEVDALTEQHTYAVIRLPERKFPGVVVQGDCLSTLVADLRRSLDASERERSTTASPRLPTFSKLCKARSGRTRPPSLRTRCPFPTDTERQTARRQLLWSSTAHNTECANVPAVSVSMKTSMGRGRGWGARAHLSPGAWRSDDPLRTSRLRYPSSRALAWVRCGPQNCSPCCGSLAHGLPFFVVARHLPVATRAAPTASTSASATSCDRSAVAG